MPEWQHAPETLEWTAARAAAFQELLHTFLAENPGTTLDDVAARAGVTVEFINSLR